MSATDSTEELRRQAVQRLRVKAGFRPHLIMYLSVNAFLVMIWAFTGVGFFWPVIPIVAGASELW